MTLNTCASMKLEVHFQRKQVSPGGSRAGKGLRGAGEWVHAGGAAVLCPVITVVCSRTAPGHTAAPGAAVHLFHHLPGQTWPGRCLAELAGACVCPVPLPLSEALAAAVKPQELLQPGWDSRGGLCRAVCLQPAASPSGSLLSRALRPPGSTSPGGSLTPEGRVRPARVSQTTINIGILITKTFIFLLMSNTFKMHASLVFSIWKSLLGVSLLVLTALILSWEGMLPCIPRCAALQCVAGGLQGGSAGMSRLPVSLEAAPSLPRCSMALGHGETMPGGSWSPPLLKGTGAGLRGCARRFLPRLGPCWWLCPPLGSLSRESGVGGRADPLRLQPSDRPLFSTAHRMKTPRRKTCVPSVTGGLFRGTARGGPGWGPSMSSLRALRS